MDSPQSIFPLSINSKIQSHNGNTTREVTLYGPMSVLIGPNGSGKTHILRGLKESFATLPNSMMALCGKKVRFLSAGRMGLMEQFRSDYDGNRGGNLRYDDATYGGRNATQTRHQTETLQGDFQTLSQRVDIQIKVQERLRKLFRRDLIIEWDAGNLKILFNRNDEASSPYSSGREASGLMHLVGLLSALYDDEVGALLIDEPEVSLHPQLQAFLLQEILDVAGSPSHGTNKKIIVIATHSTEMIRLQSVDDLPHLIFCNDLRTDPVQIHPDTPDLKNKKIKNLVASLGQLHRLSLFSTRPLLVEGVSDSIICQALARKLKLFPEAAGSQILPVEGKGNLVVVANLLRLMGKSPTLLADLDGFADGPALIQNYLSAIPEASSAEAASCGAASGSQLAKSIHDALCEMTDRKWSIIEPLAVTHPYWRIDATNEKIKQRRALLGTLFCNTDADLMKLECGVKFVNLKARISALFDLAEKCGLFFCRRGTIECHYFGEISAKDFDKPQAATEEVTRLIQHTVEEVDSQYYDVVHCMQFASNVEKICEAEALQDLLLSIAAPAQGRLFSDTIDGNLNTLSQQVIGDKSRLFTIIKQDNNIKITISSNILDVSDCFPIIIDRYENVVTAVGKALKLSK